MRSSVKKRLVQLCDVCGDVGYEHLLSTCSVCRGAHEHIYCMRSMLVEVPDIWICEACRSHNCIVSTKSDVKKCRLKASMSHSLHSVGPSRFHAEEEVRISDKKRKTLGMGNDFWKVPDANKTIGSPTGKPETHPFSRNNISKKVQTAKVKFLPTEDVCTLTSRAKSKASPLCVGSRTIASKSFHQKGFTYRSPGHSKPLTLGTMHASSTLQTPAVKLLEPLHGEKSLPHFQCNSSISERSRNKQTEEEYQLGEPLASLKSEPSARKVLSQTKMRGISEVFQPRSNSFGSVNHCIKKKSDDPWLLGLDKSTGASSALKHVHKEKPVDASITAKEVGSSSSRISPTFRGECPNSPSINAIWKGSFEIHDAVYPDQFCDGLWASPPGKVSCKAYNFSKQMPGILRVQLQPRFELWPDIFQMDCPNGDDIALYFFPSDFDRSNQKYYCLLELIEVNDLAMRICFDGVELLIFTSKQLPVNSQRINSKLYFWGVFRSMKVRFSRVAGTLENAAGSSQNLLSTVHPHQPTEITTGVHALVEIKREQFDEGDSSGLSTPITCDATRRQALGKSLLKMPPYPCGLEVPPGCSRPIKLKERDTSEVIRKKEKYLMADANGIGPLQKENRAFESASRGALKVLSLQPEKPIKGPQSAEVPSNCCQVISRGLPMDFMAADPTYLSRKSRYDPPSSVIHINPKYQNQQSTKNVLHGLPENFEVWDDPERKGKRRLDESPGKISQKEGSSSAPRHEILAGSSLQIPGSNSELLVPPGIAIHINPKGQNQQSTKNGGVNGLPENFGVRDASERKGKRRLDQSPGKISQKEGSSGAPRFEIIADGSLQIPVSNSELLVSPRSVKGCLQLFPQEIKIEDEELGTRTAGFVHVPGSKGKVVEGGDCPMLCFSRPQYLKDGATVERCHVKGTHSER